MRRFFLPVLLFAVFAIGLLTPSHAQAASLYLSPSSGSYAVGSSFSVSVGVNTVGVAINSAQATISFPNDILDVTSIAQAGIFTLWPVSPTYSNASGTVSFAGGLPTPGYTGSAGTIITITFNAKVAGTANVTIGSASVLANDGLGTNVLTSQGSGSYVISAAIVEPEPEPEPELDLPDAPVISSPTHPEQALWYSNADPAFTWTSQDGVVGYSIVFDDQSDTDPDRVRDVTDSSSSHTGTGDGVWYFHVRAQNEDGWSQAGHYKVQIDTTAPLAFSIELLDGKRTVKTSPRVSFETTDETSGVHHYSLTVNGGNPIGIDIGSTTPYILSDLEVGKYSLVARAYDLADNVSQAENSFTIFSSTEPRPADTEEEPEEVPAILETLEKIKETLPEPIQRITEKIGETIQQLKENKIVTQTIDDVFEPLVATSAVVVVTGLAATASSTQIFNLIYLFFRFGYFWLVPVSFGKKRKSWGVVFDSISGQPVPRAVVKIFSREFNKLRESQIADREGRFGFIVDEGVYYITVSNPGYVFPSRVLRTAAVSQYDNIYRGDTITIDERTIGLLSVNIPIDPNMKEVSNRRLRWIKFVSFFGMIIEKINMPLLIGGTILSWITLILEPKLGNYLLLGLYVGLILFRVIVNKRKGRTWGIAKDRDTGQPIEQVIVRIFNADSGNIVWTRVTNQKGQFSGLLSPGKYYLVFIKYGYETFRSKSIMVTKRKGYIRFTAELQAKTKKTPPSATHKDVEIHLEDVPVTMKEEEGKISSTEIHQVKNIFEPPPQVNIRPGTKKSADKAGNGKVQKNSKKSRRAKK